MHVFYQPEPFGQQTRLSAEESHHLARVLRLRQGEQIKLLDGRGGIYSGLILDPDPRSSLIGDIKEENQIQPRPYRLHIAMAPTKMQERFEWFLEKATEIGIDEITPLLTHRGDRDKINDGRAMKILISAMKQSMNARLPQLNPPAKIAELINHQEDVLILIAHCLPGPKVYLAEAVREGGNILLLIGPEGDFTPEEIEFSTKAGAKEVSLGNSRLRTETAGITACALVAGMNHREFS
jgi:16S rRNA (uracil1498-N3)-methyltransferase